MKLHKNDILNTIVSFFNSRPEVVAVYLCGSYAQNREKVFSDVDVGVLLMHKALPQRNELITIYTTELARRLRKDFHIIIMNTAGEMILSQIFKRGKCIFQRDPRLLSHFKTVSFSKIADFGYFRKSMERAFLSRIIGD